MFKERTRSWWQYSLYKKFSLDKVVKKLESSTDILFHWFRENHMKANADKYHLSQLPTSLISLQRSKIFVSKRVRKKNLTPSFCLKAIFPLCE